MEERRGSSHAKGGQKTLYGRETDGFEDSSHPGLNKGADTKFRLPVEPTESIDRHQEYPPIVTADGEVDTDIDHLMVNPEDDYVDLPIQDIPNRFPNPRVVTVIEGSLDDDIDNLMNHDGTMTHTLMDAPKNFQPGDLKEINANKEGKKHHRSYHKMDKVEAEESFAVRNYELVPAREQNNSSEKYPEDEAPFANEKGGLGEGEGELQIFLETDKTKGSEPPDLEKIGDVAPDIPNEEVPLATEKDSGFSWPGRNPRGDSYLIKIDDDSVVPQCDDDNDDDDGMAKKEKQSQDEVDIIGEEEKTINDGYCDINKEDLEAKEERSSETAAIGTVLENEPNAEKESSQIDTELIEDLTIMCIDVINQLALAEKSLGHLEQQQQLLAIANVLKHRIPTEKRSKRCNLQQKELTGDDVDATKDNIDGLSCENSADLNSQAKIMLQNLLKQVAVMENAAIISSVEKSSVEEDTRENEAQNDDVGDRSKGQTLAFKSTGTDPVSNPQQFVSTEPGATQTSIVNPHEDTSISAALKVAGDSMTAAARIADALSLLIKNIRNNESPVQTSQKSLRSKEVKEYFGKAHSKSISGRKHYNTGGYQMYNVLGIPSFDNCSVLSGRSLKVEDVSSVDDIGSKAMYHSKGMRRRNAEVYQSVLPQAVRYVEKPVNEEEYSDFSMEGRRRNEHRRRSKSCKEDGTLCLELQHVMPSAKLHHRRHSESRCSGGCDISSKDDGLRIAYMNPNEISENQRKKDSKGRISSKDKRDVLDLTKLRERDGRRKTIRSPDGVRPPRQHRSGKSERKSIEYACDSSMKETSKSHRHKEGNSLDIHVTNALSESISVHERKRKRANHLSTHKQHVSEGSTPSDKQVDLEIVRIVSNSTPADTQVVSNEEYKDGEALPKEVPEDDGVAVVACDSTTIDETWSLPARCVSPCDSYFDRIVRGLKPWAPPSQTSASKTKNDIIRTKLVGSVVDPDTRDSDFDSIEFNGNARVSFSKMVRFTDEEDWSPEEGWEYDSSSSDCIPSCSRWYYEF